MKLIPHNQGSPAWLEWRRGGLGGSDIAAILSLSPYEDATRESVFADKVHGTEREANFAMRRGQRLEPHARFAYETRQRCSAPPVCVEMDGCPWARVSLDGFCSTHAAINPEQRVLELKCPNWETHALALEGVVPEHFEVQIQWQLLVCGLDRCDFASFSPTERFTPDSFPLMGKWRELCNRWLAKPKCDREARPELLDLWAEIPQTHRPEMPGEWLAIHEVKADADRQAWIMGEAAEFWIEVCEARAGLALEAKAKSVEAQFA